MARFSRRRHAAPAARVAATGLSTSAVFGLLAALASHAAPQGAAPTAIVVDQLPTDTAPIAGVAPAPVDPGPPPTTIVVTKVPRRIVVEVGDDQPIPPRSTSGATPATPATPTPQAAPAPAPTVAPPVTSAPAPRPTVPTPTCRGSKC